MYRFCEDLSELLKNFWIFWLIETFLIFIYFYIYLEDIFYDNEIITFFILIFVQNFKFFDFLLFKR